MGAPFISDSLHPNGHSGELRGFYEVPETLDMWNEPLAVLDICDVWFECYDEFDCTVAIDYTQIWRIGTVFCTGHKKADFVDPIKMGVAMYCPTPEDDVLIPPLFIDTATKANRQYAATYTRSVCSFLFHISFLFSYNIYTIYICVFML